LKSYPLYLVTDGHKIVQQKKVTALGIEPQFQKIFITHRYGLRNAKPSTYCFDLIRKRERCQWADLVYVADNPAKDFVNLNKLRVRTVRVLTGAHKSTRAKKGHDARYTISNLSHLRQILSLAKPGA
jgi:putative hydrolase of the HAD superfamily